MLLALLGQPLPVRGELRAALGEFVQRDDLGLVRVEQPGILAPEPGDAGDEFLVLGARERVTRTGGPGGRLELRDQARRVVEQLAQVRPDGRLQVVAPDRPARADGAPAAEDRVLAAAAVVARLAPRRAHAVGRPVHRQAARRARRQAAEQVAVFRVVAERERGVAGELAPGAGERLGVDERRHRDRNPLLPRPELAAGRVGRAGAAGATRFPRRDEPEAVGVGGAGVDRVGEHMVDRRRAPACPARPRPPRAGVEPLQDLPDGHALLDQPSVHQPHHRRPGLLDDDVPERTVGLGDVAVAVGRRVGVVLAGAGLLELAAPEPLAQQRPLVLGDRALDLEQEVVVRVVADGVLDEQDRAAGPPELVEQQHLVDVLARQAVGAEHGDRLTLLKVTQTSSLLLALLLAALTWLGVVQLWHFLLVAVASSTVLAFDNPARQALIPDLVPREDLMSAISLNSVSFTGAQLVGPAVAGLILAAFAERMLEAGAVVFLVNAVSYLAVLLPLFVIRPRAEHAAARRPPAAAGGRANPLAEGLRYVRAQPVLLLLVGTVAVTSVFGRSFTYLLPVFARDVLAVGGAGLGWLNAAAGGGTVVAGLLLAGHAGALSRRRLIVGGIVALTIAIYGVVLSGSYPLSLLLLALTGAASTVASASVATQIQSTVPGHLRGRVMSLNTLCLIGLSPVGSAVSALLARVFSVQVAVGAAASVMLLSLLATLASPRIRRVWRSIP